MGENFVKTHLTVTKKACKIVLHPIQKEAVPAF
jgi:hypothetical protein